VGYKERNRLMSNAAAVIVPTLYIEPFGGVAVEAMLAGAPVLAHDWGSFTEIVIEPFGKRFRTLAQGAQAIKEMREWSKSHRKEIRSYAMGRFSQQAVGPMFMRWFDQLDSLWGKGFYE
jgi:glycosyltransferase involved in cell wall biosynthesis